MVSMSGRHRKQQGLPPGFRRLGDDVPVRGKTPLPAWLVGLMIAVVIFVSILILSYLLGIGDDPVVEEGMVSTPARALTEISTAR
jgi:hypothetical protein